jgi:acyl carrier protein
MASLDHQSEIVDILAKKTGLSRETLHLSDRLVQDLGIDGDDAVELFDSLHQRFGTDLTHLHEHWSDHFGPEFSCLNVLIVVPAAALGGVVAALANLSAFWAIAITLALVATWHWAVRRRGATDRLIPVTIRDLVAAVEAGAWPSPPES